MNSAQHRDPRGGFHGLPRWAAGGCCLAPGLDRSIIHFLKFGRFQLRMNLVAPVRDTLRELMWGLYFSSQQQTGEPQTSTTLINNECCGGEEADSRPTGASVSSGSNLNEFYTPQSLPPTARFEKRSWIKGSDHLNDKDSNFETKNEAKTCAMIETTSSKTLSC